MVRSIATLREILSQPVNSRGMTRRMKARWMREAYQAMYAYRTKEFHRKSVREIQREAAERARTPNTPEWL